MEDITLQRTTSGSRRSANKIILPSHNRRTFSTFSTSSGDAVDVVKDKPLVRRTHSPLCLSSLSKMRSNFCSFLGSLLGIISLQNFAAFAFCCLKMPNHLSVAPSDSHRVTGTLFGKRKGHVSFAVQFHPRSEPALLIEWATSTAALVKNMSSGLVHIALECEKGSRSAASAAHGRALKLFEEPVWTMYCNGRKCGHAKSRACSEFDWYVLSTIRSMSVGAGVIPLLESPKRGGASGGRVSEGELVYMRARFDRVVGSGDSEAFYMLNPDGNGGPELSIFLLRL
ncbi:hypothetical protein Nepgr_022006 [Nepenthes gracilis]|uniref:Protein MIZU-KUSSEI 1 n=1 Tax=Nepenthes gracilis TaxID=150966 RepID=A0AAD3SYL7_NEPGR|nr:hypothetical protein Nepgr_022006 [Nepenthes gracilis]